MKRALLILVCLTACGTEASKKADVSNLEQAVRAQLAKHAVDPTSIIIDGLIDKEAVTCGRVNAKNRSGNYTGWTRFVALKKADVVAFDETGNPSISEAVQNANKVSVFNSNYQDHCETAKERSGRISSELALRQKQKVEEQERQKAERLAEREQKAMEMKKWASGNWVTQGKTEVCGEYSTSVKYMHPDGSLTGSVFNPGDTWKIDADGNVEELSSRWGANRYTMKKVSDNIAVITHSGEQAKRFERCPR
jgi:hypothetical protein